MKTERKLFRMGVCIVICVVFIGFSGLYADEDEQVVVLGDAPEAVRQTLAEYRQGEVPSRLVREVEDGFVFYEAEFSQDDGKCEVKTDEEGRIVEVEEELALSLLPAEARNSILSAYPNAEIEEVDLKQSTFYVVEVEEGDKEVEVKVLANGLILGVNEDD